MENRVQPKERTDDELQAFYAMIVFLICAECSKEPEIRCEKCDKVYKQLGRYHAHLAKCNDVEVPNGLRGGEGGGGEGGGGEGGGGGGPSVSASEFSELLRQNREMMVLLQKQQETIQTLVSQLSK